MSGLMPGKRFKKRGLSGAPNTHYTNTFSRVSGRPCGEPDNPTRSEDRPVCSGQAGHGPKTAPARQKPSQAASGTASVTSDDNLSTSGVLTGPAPRGPSEGGGAQHEGTESEHSTGAGSIPETRCPMRDDSFSRCAGDPGPCGCAARPNPRPAQPVPAAACSPPPPDTASVRFSRLPETQGGGGSQGHHVPPHQALRGDTDSKRTAKGSLSCSLRKPRWVLRPTRLHWGPQTLTLLSWASASGQEAGAPLHCKPIPSTA